MKNSKVSGQAIFSIFKYERQGLLKYLNTTANNDAIFSKQTSNLVDFGRSLLHQFTPDAVNWLNILLGDRFNGNKPHSRTCNRFTNGFSIVGVVFVGFNIRFYKLWRHQFDGMSPSFCNSLAQFCKL